jgi:type III pantothenate kinase
VAALQRLLTIDCGNSTIRCRRSDGAVWSTTTAQPEWHGLLPFVGQQATRAIAVSVVPSALHAVCKVLSLREPALDVEVVGVQLQCPLRLHYRTVATLGADRWLGAYAAYRRFGAAITIDCGTATTVNVVAADGVFHGGAIAPGLAAFVAGMASTAPALPAANLDADPVMPGTTTQECVDAGVLLGWVGLVERLIQDASRCAPNAQLVATGGNATRFLRLSPLARASGKCEFVPELLHDGMVALAEQQRTSGAP